jgi:ribonuclease HI
MNNTFECGKCGKSFTVPEAALKKYPGWTPRVCMPCKDAAGGGKKAKSKSKKRTRKKSRTATENLTLAQVLASYSGGPDEGVFTDGSSQPNPGPGGWGAVMVSAGEVIGQRYGHDPDTTNNRMELTALIEAARLVPEGQTTKIFTDSALCVNTLTKWAKGWEKNGWRRKGGEIKNLELVQEAFALYSARPELHLQWVQAHDGNRWNEYADALSTAWARAEL